MRKDFTSSRQFRLLISALLFTAVFFARAPLAHATLTLNPEPGFGIPIDRHNDLTECDTSGKSPAFARWISPPGDPGSQIISVPYGTPYIDLDYHLAGAVCYPSSAVFQTSQLVVNAVPFVFDGSTYNLSSGLSGIVGDLRWINYTGFYGPGNFDQPGTYRHTSQTFRYTPPGGFTTSAFYKVSLTVKRINQFSSGDFLCVGGSEPQVSTFTDFYHPGKVCADAFPELNFLVLVGPPTLFKLEPSASAVLDNDENPTSVDTSGGVTLSDGATVVNNVSITRKYYIKRGAAIIPYSPDATEVRNATSFNYPIITKSGLTPVIGDQYCTSVTVSPYQGIVDGSGNVISGGSSNKTDESCDTFISKPYVSFYGNDILAGADFQTAGVCSGAGSGSIDVTSDVPNLKGSSVQFAAQAFTNISGILTASTRTGAPATKPNGLTFANSPVGGFGGTLPCIPDYYKAISNNGGTSVGPNLGATTIGLGQHEAFYVDGDLYIAGNVKFQTNATGGWSSIPDIPSLYVVAKGNIYIGSGVTRLDGVYIAQPNGATGGRIVTCSPAPPATYTSDDLFGNCGNQLTINGAFIAKNVSFLRTAYSLRNASSGETAPNSKAAEVFSFGPEIYLAIPHDSIKTATSGPSRKYDYFASLPPLL